MAVSQALTSTPTALGPATDVVAGTDYSFQNRSMHPTYVQVSAAVPTNTDNAFVLSGMGTAQLQRASGQQIYVWQDSNIGNNYGRVVWDIVPS